MKNGKDYDFFEFWYKVLHYTMKYTIAPYWNWLKAQANFDEVFRIDLRSLAVVRILSAAILIGDIFTRIPDIAMFYGDQSVMPVALQHTFFAGDYAWSVHTLFGGPYAWVALVFCVQIFFAASLLVGFWTRTSSVISWLLLVSLHHANPMILLGGDFLLRQTVLAGMFVPWGEVFSLDRYLSRKPTARLSITSVWSAVFLIQIAYMYYFASMYKSSIEWNVDGSAFYYILSIDQYVTPAGRILLQFPGLLKFLTIGVTIFQHFVIFLLFLPICNRYIRTATVATLMLMHLCFGIGTHLGIFSWISMAALVAFIPAMGWDWLGIFFVRGKKRLMQNVYRWTQIPVEESRKKKTQSKSTLFISVLGVLYILTLFLWQAAEFMPAIKQYAEWDYVTVPYEIFRLDQHWNLFAPRPYTDDGWDVVEGHLADGSAVDLFRGGAPITYEKPADVYAIYGISHRRQYTLDLRKPYNDKYRAYYGAYVCKTWNAVHTGGERLVSLKHAFMLEETPSPDDPPIPVTPETLLSLTCPAV